MTPTSQERAAAIEWLEGATHPLMSVGDDISHTNTIKALLARPTVPGICDHKAIDELAQRSGVARGIVALVIEKMHEPPKPATKEIEVEYWGVIWREPSMAIFPTVYPSEAEALYASRDRPGQVVRLTGKATSSKGSE